MKYSLDTNTCIRYINGRSSAIRQKLPTVPAWDIVVCSVVRGELAYGAAKSQTPDESAAKQARFLKPYATLSFDDVAAQEYGRIRAYLEKAGTPIGPYDMQIAAIAIRCFPPPMFTFQKIPFLKSRPSPRGGRKCPDRNRPSNSASPDLSRPVHP